MNPNYPTPFKDLMLLQNLINSKTTPINRILTEIKQAKPLVLLPDNLSDSPHDCCLKGCQLLEMGFYHTRSESAPSYNYFMLSILLSTTSENYVLFVVIAIIFFRGEIKLLAPSRFIAALSYDLLPWESTTYT